jgi:hypothetical protein
MRYPLLYQINTRVILGEISTGLGRIATFDDVPRQILDDIGERGFEWVWMLGVWQTGAAGRAVSLAQIDSFRAALPDIRPADVCGSPYAIADYHVHHDFGGERALAGFRTRLRRRGLKLLLDFVPNHIAPDHPWVAQHPEWLIRGTEEDLQREPQNYARFETGRGPMILAYGRDPYFSGWSDTVQLNYRHPGLRQAMRDTLLSVAAHCDGVRCDMAMLVEPDVFARTWGDRSLPWDGTPPVDGPFWPEAIAAVRAVHPGFAFMAEVYWDMEFRLQQEGFDYTYDKRLYDRLHAGGARAVRDHLHADPRFQDRSARFLENHDEPRAARVFPLDQHRAAAAVTYLVPGLRFFHEGQLQGRRVHVPMHIGRRPLEPVDPAISKLYDALFYVLGPRETHDGEWHLWEPRPAWDGNPSWDQFLVFSWVYEERRLLVTVNYGPSPAQCYVSVPLPGLAGHQVRLDDLLSPASYVRSGDEIMGHGLYLDVPAWQVHAFEVHDVVAEQQMRSDADEVPIDADLVGV